MFQFLLLVHALIAAALVTVILMQRSEGGGLGMGGSPSGLMSARGAADFLTRMTSILAALFIGFSILLAVLASQHRATTIDTSLVRQAPVSPGIAPPPNNPALGQQNAAAIAAEGANAAPADNSVPLER